MQRLSLRGTVPASARRVNDPGLSVPADCVVPPPQASYLPEYLGILRVNKSLILAAATIGLLAGLALTAFEKPKYEARMTLEIEGLNDNFLNMKTVDPLAANEYSSESYIQTQIKIIGSKSMLAAVASKLGLFEPKAGATSHDSGSVHAAEAGDRTDETARREAIIAGISNHLKVQASGLTRIVELSYQSTNPHDAALFLNTLAHEYIDQTANSRFTSTQSTTVWLNRQLEDLKSKLEKSDDDLQEYARSAGLLFTGEKNNLAEEKLSELQTDLMKAQEDRAVKQARYELAKSSPSESLPDIVDDASLREYQLKLTDLRRQLADLSTTMTPDHYKVKEIQAQVAALQTALNQRRDEIIGRIQNDFAAAERREQLMFGQYTEHVKTVSDQRAKAIHYTLLQQSLDSTRQLYEDVHQKIKEAEIGAALRTSNIRVIDAAEPPSKPIQPSMPINSAAGLCIGAFAGIGFVTVRQRSNRTIQDPGHGSMYLNLPELGVIPLAKRVSQLGRVTLELEPAIVAEAFRATSASIVFSAGKSKAGKVLVVTSPERGAGKSTVVSNLGIGLGVINRRVLIIGGDIRKPRLHNIFDLPNSAGLCEVLLSDEPIAHLNLDAVIQKTNVPHLFVLPCGKPDMSVVNLLHSDRMVDLLKRCKEKFDFVLIDTPPMLQISDARVLGRGSDGVILVLRCGLTTRDSAMTAVQRLSEDAIPILGVILNSWDPTKTINPPYGKYDSVKYAYKDTDGRSA